MSKTAQIASEIRRIALANGGKVTPDAVVAAAKAKTSPLHDSFTWDDRKAAHERRLDQARTLIRSVRVDVTTTSFTLHAPEFVRDPSAVGQGYASLASLRSDEDNAREAVVAEFSRASAALSRAKAVAAALGISDQIEEIRGRVVELSDSLQHVETEVAA